MNFIPETPKEEQEVPYFDDVTEKDGWQGMATTKSIETLQNEITNALFRLGAHVLSFQRGKYQGKTSRDGFRVHYVLMAADGRNVPGRIDIAALPVKTSYSLSRTEKKRRDQALRMALYMLRTAMQGAWNMQQLSPGFSALVPFMLGQGTDKTISELWSESPIMNNLLPPGDEEFIEGEAREL
ncbi:MAG: hypothetical protein A2136_05565 [Chloroflexi bacterium RBG_16_54_11]|nr:MAG: hypothetical protein A2136_05565 [Chloroflexi bacterium RBG_16_54_11]